MWELVQLEPHSLTWTKIADPCHSPPWRFATTKLPTAAQTGTVVIPNQTGARCSAGRGTSTLERGAPSDGPSEARQAQRPSCTRNDQECGLSAAFRLMGNLCGE